MPRILILGATGYLGNRVANLLVQSGQHTVYGVARSSDKALQLAGDEITPVLCPDPANSPEQYLSTIRSSSIDIVIDCAQALQQGHSFLENIKKVGKERLDAYKARGTGGPKLGFIYCSGVWVHGSSNKAVTDLDMVGPDAATQPAELVAWRVDLENAILDSHNVLDVMILRPALVYGRQPAVWSSFIAPVFEATRNKTMESIQVPLDPKSRPGLVHVDDSATAFVKAVEKLPLIAGSGVHPVFDLVTSQESMCEIFNALAACWGYDGEIQLVGHDDDIVRKAVSTTFRGSSARAEQLLGWQPKRLGGFVTDMDIYAAAFAAHLSSTS
ncbi:hypothetical protein TMatcc_008176 [Talaromyces marneffei ATCC 18224]|uniref:NAD-dependent epimerase/dehydratase domain-containing protein n=1 Tax=Talaromyces marneffei (strain ATCC 18224 / CBS 334.59 / QM 7333) TaxID=441960 RepID=B6QN77_TALMQ|nr:conserved hypothetical protein [Talaromyces marneffei ATCC 18224]